MRTLLALFLLGGCAPAAEPCVAAPATIPVAVPTTSAVNEPIALTDKQLGVTYEIGEREEYTERTVAQDDHVVLTTEYYAHTVRTITLDGGNILTTRCTGKVITFTFDVHARSHVFACGDFVGSIGSGGSLTIRFEDHGPKYDVPVYKVCGEERAELIVSANRELADVRCPRTGASKSYDGDSAFVNYVIN